MRQLTLTLTLTLTLALTLTLTLTLFLVTRVHVKYGRFAFVEFESGFAPRVTAYFQALMEYNIHPPEGVVGESTLKDYFELFWDAEVPRIGEEGSSGWGRWVEGAETQMKDEEVNQDQDQDKP